MFLTRNYICTSGTRKGMSTRIVLRTIKIIISLLLLGSLFQNQILLRKYSSSFSSFLEEEIFPRSNIFTPATENNDNHKLNTISPFCESIRDAIITTPSNNDYNNAHHRMIHGFVSNSGHLPILMNALLSIEKSSSLSDWKSVVFSMGNGNQLCEDIKKENLIDPQKIICIPYLQRMLQQLERDEPESMKQIMDTIEEEKKRKKGKKYKNNNGTEEVNNTKFHTIDQTFYEWGSVEHKFLINAKLYALRDILHCNVDAFITDTDVAFVKDPRPYFYNNTRGNSNPNNNTELTTIDIIAQDDTTNQYLISLNSGLMYWKYTKQNLNLSDQLVKFHIFWWIDQSRVSWLLHNQSIPVTLLDRKVFPNGNILKNSDFSRENIVMCHANWNSGQKDKEEMLQQSGFWYYNTSNTTAITKE